MTYNIYFNKHTLLKDKQCLKRLGPINKLPQKDNQWIIVFSLFKKIQARIDK